MCFFYSLFGFRDSFLRVNVATTLVVWRKKVFSLKQEKTPWGLEMIELHILL